MSMQAVPIESLNETNSNLWDIAIGTGIITMNVEMILQGFPDRTQTSASLSSDSRIS
jgi:hypothetical protein